MRFDGNKQTRSFSLMGHWLIYWIIVLVLTLLSSIHYYRHVSYWVVVGAVFIVLITFNILFATRKKKKHEAMRRKAYKEARAEKQGGPVRRD
jgi:L-asparagine transporter-like permease